MPPATDIFSEHCPRPGVPPGTAHGLQYPVPGRPAAIQTGAERGEYPDHVADQVTAGLTAAGHHHTADLGAGPVHAEPGPGPVRTTRPPAPAARQVSRATRRSGSAFRSREDTRASSPYDEAAGPAGASGDTSTVRWLTPTAGTGRVPPRNHRYAACGRMPCARPLSQIHPTSVLTRTHVHPLYSLIREQLTTPESARVNAAQLIDHQASLAGVADHGDWHVVRLRLVKGHFEGRRQGNREEDQEPQDRRDPPLGRHRMGVPQELMVCCSNRVVASGSARASGGLRRGNGGSGAELTVVAAPLIFASWCSWRARSLNWSSAGLKPTFANSASTTFRSPSAMRITVIR